MATYAGGPYASAPYAGSTPATHDVTGALVGPGSTLAGSAARFRAFTATGALVGQGSTIVGSANRFRAHTTTGALVGPSSTVSGSAARFRAHTATGALVGPGSTLAGTASVTPASSTGLHGRRVRGRKPWFEIEPEIAEAVDEVIEVVAEIPPQPTGIAPAEILAALRVQEARVAEIGRRIADRKAVERTKAQERAYGALLAEIAGLEARISDAEAVYGAYMQRLRDEDEFIILYA